MKCSMLPIYPLSASQSRVSESFNRSVSSHAGPSALLIDFAIRTLVFAVEVILILFIYFMFEEVVERKLEVLIEEEKRRLIDSAK